MSKESKYWIGIWIILMAFIHTVPSSSESAEKIPYDVVLPPDGNGESSPPVIMLHSLLDWRKTWKKLAPEIANNTGRKVYAYDAINHGENAWSDEFHLNILVTELDHFMEDQNISKAILVGHSMGGKTAMIFAARKPEMVEKLVIEDISPKKPTTNVLKLLKQAYLASKMFITEFQYEVDELAAKKVVTHFLKRIIFTKEQVKDLGEDFLMEWIPITKRGEKIDLRGNLDLFIKIGNTQTPDDWDPGVDGEFHGDVLFVYGSKSPFNVSTDELISKHFPHSTLVKFEGGSHFPHLEFAKEFARVVSDFINKKKSIQ